MTTTLPTYAIAHGGGPWPWMKDRMPIDWTPLEAALQSIPTELGNPPRAVLMVTAHWEAPAFTVQTNPAPGMLYDYWGFPDDTYDIVYGAPGEPAVAARVVELLTAAGIDAGVDPDRGFDHGTFVPAFVMYPEAQVPVVQLSIRQDFEPEAHLELGRALAPLRDEGVLIVGSGLPSYHNLSAMGPASADPSRRFDTWLTETMSRTGAERSDLLASWTDAPAARIAHPREDHFLPLLVAVGAAEDDEAVRNYHEPDSFGGSTTSSGYRLGDLG